MLILAVGRSDLEYPSGTKRCSLASGFTLLEILLVIIILAVASALIAPNFSRQASENLEEEAAYIVSLLRMGAEEAQLTGTPIRWTAMERGYRFAQAVGDSWQAMQAAPFAPVTLPGEIHIDHLERQDGAIAPDDEKSRKQKVLGHLLFYPDGMLTLAEFELISGGDESEESIERLRVQIRPGATGIKVVKDQF